MKNLKILHFFPWTSWGTLGGTEKYIIEIAKYQSEKNTVFIAYPVRQNIGIKINNHSTIIEIQLSDPNPNSNSLIGMGIVIPTVIREWIKLLKSERFDIIHFHCYEQYLVWYLIAAKLHSIKIVFTPHVVNFTCLNGNLINAITRQTCEGRVLINSCTKCVLALNNKNSYYKFATQSLNILVKKINLAIVKLLINKTITINYNYTQVLKNNGFKKDKIKMIRPYIQKKILTEENNHTKLIPDKLKVIYIGRLSNLKGLNILLKSFKNIKSSKISLHIYGPKGDFDVNNFISENILYHGIFPFSEINSILKKYDVLCLPSISYEMMPLVIQEAINNGLYIIGSDVPGIMELVNQETNGVIVERNNVASLTQALIDLEINYRRNDNFTIESFRSISDRILKEYEIVVSDN